MRHLLLLALAACAANPTGPNQLGQGGGKADGDGSGSDSCTTRYIEWALGTLAPAISAQPIDDARENQLVVLAGQAPCTGEPLDPTAFTTWSDLGTKLVFAPYIAQHAAALPAFVHGAQQGDYNAYLANTTPPASAAAIVNVLAAARPTATLEDIDVDDWVGKYRTLAEEVLVPLTLETTNIGDYEGPWTVNAGEGAILDLAASTRPDATADGGYGAWVSEYGDIIAHGVDTTSSDDDYVGTDPALGCWQGEAAPCSRDRVLDRFKALAPAAQGALDSDAWMHVQTLWASLRASSTAATANNDEAQLERVQTSGPAQPTGLAAYQTWLAAVPTVAASASVFADAMVPTKPCVSGSDADAAYAAFASANASLSSDVLAAAKPSACN